MIAKEFERAGQEGFRVSKKNWALIVAFIVIAAGVMVGVALFKQNYDNGNHIINNVVQYANSKHLPSDIVDILKPLGQNGEAVSDPSAPYTREVIDEIHDLGNYSDSPMVLDVIKTIVSHGTMNYTDFLRIQDVDQDGITNNLEMTTYHTDPTNMYSFGSQIDDFNRIFTYGINPYNQTAEKEVLANIPNVVANHWNPTDGGTPFTTQKIVSISERDPLVQCYAKRAEIKWSNTISPANPTGQMVVGTFLVDGNPIHHSGISNSITADQPSYYLTHGRIGNCFVSTDVNLSILKLMGYKAIEVDSKVPVNGIMEGHASSEVYIDGKVYVVNSNDIIPREGLYAKYGWELDPSYDPNWYLK